MKKIVFVCLLASTIYAAELDRGMHALKNKQYQLALNEFLILAKQGNKIAQQNLGVMYNAGLGVKKDSMRAAYWFNIASNTRYTYEKIALN
jgi:TPR repeat protein